ncbi:hypothetical protein RCL1_007148 [Eukaryota sp. TZLM3-RCL]
MLPPLAVETTIVAICSKRSFSKKSKSPSPINNCLRITNATQAKKAFLAQRSAFNIAPLFRYQPSSPSKSFFKYSIPETEWFSLSQRIISSTITKHGTYSSFSSSIFGSVILAPSAVLTFINNYITSLKVSKALTIKYKRDMISPFAVSNSTLFIRLPLTSMTLIEVTSMCHHELSTHFLRYFNQKRLPKGLRSTFKEIEILQTEEGLATLNTILSWNNKSIFKAAWHYYSCVKAQNMTFTELFNHLLNFLGKNSLKQHQELCWEECLRVKRGIHVTSNGSFAKDQVYLIGLLKLLKFRRNINWKLLYSGIFAVEDLPRLQSIVDVSDVKMPVFYHSDAQYVALLDQIVIDNGLEDIVGNGDVLL